MLLKLKDKEIKDMISVYEGLKEKFSKDKKGLLSKKEDLTSNRKANLNLKKIICGMLVSKNK